MEKVIKAMIKRWWDEDAERDWQLKYRWNTPKGRLKMRKKKNAKTT